MNALEMYHNPHSKPLYREHMRVRNMPYREVRTPVSAIGGAGPLYSRGLGIAYIMAVADGDSVSSGYTSCQSPAMEPRERYIATNGSLAISL